MATQQTEERKTSRDEFSQDIKKRLSERVGLHCSNPDCDIITKAPSSESNSSVNNIGVAAHICAAASGKGARRYKPSMTPEERSSIENGIWLCCNCSVKIDRDEKTYTEELLQNWKSDAENKALKRFGNKVYSKEEIDEVIDAYKKQHQLDAEQIKNLTVTVTALAQGQTNATQLQIDAAFAALRKGDSSLALSLFEAASDHFEKEAKKGAEIQRSIGILAFLDDTQKSLKAYRRATQLDPENADGWNELGHLLLRIGELDEAINAFQTVLRLGEEHKDQQEITMAYGNLGIVYQTRGDLDKAVEYYHKSLKIDESLGNKKGIARHYGNLGNVHLNRGDLDKAIEYYNKSLKINESLGRKEDMAISYANLGLLYETKKYYKKAREYWGKSFSLFQALGSPNAKEVQSWLDSLPQ